MQLKPDKGFTPEEISDTFKMNDIKEASEILEGLQMLGFMDSLGTTDEHGSWIYVEFRSLFTSCERA